MIKKIFLGKAVMLGFALGVTACGASPVLHHDTPNRVPQSMTNSSHSGTSSETPKFSCDFEFSSEKLCAQLNWIKKPSSEEPGEFKLSFWKKDQNPNASVIFQNPEAPQVFVKLWMPDMGHGSSPVTVTQASDGHGAPVDGVFSAKGVFFIMTGKWEIQVQLRSSEGVARETSKMIYWVK